MTQEAPADRFGLAEYGVVQQLLSCEQILRALSGPDRAYFLVEFEGCVALKCAAVHDPPLDFGGIFGRNSTLLWNSYTVGRTIPVVMARLQPTILTTAFAALLPGTDVEGCAACGDWPLTSEHECPCGRAPDAGEGI